MTIIQDQVNDTLDIVETTETTLRNNGSDTVKKVCLCNLILHFVKCLVPGLVEFEV